MLHLFRILLPLILLLPVVWTGCDDKEDQHETLPEAPSLLSVDQRGNDWVRLSWYDRAINEDGFFIYSALTGESFSRIDTVDENPSSSTIYHDVFGLEQGSSYSMYVTAYNEIGESDTSNHVQFVTGEVQLPFPPADVQAEALSQTRVAVTWENQGYSDNVTLVIARSLPDGDWSELGTAGHAVETYVDNTTEAETTYIYRVGARITAGTSWSDASPEVTTPSMSVPPAPPENLELTIELGVGVVLDWFDASENETEFHIARNRQGQPFEIIDTVGANVTTYTDSLGDNVNVYNYKVRAANQFGVSAWTQPGGADYRYCSAGIIPVCYSPQQNYWDYRVTIPREQEDDSVFEIRRWISDAVFINGEDYYLETQDRWPDGGDPVHRYYLRNFEGLGCFGQPYPLPGVPDPQLLFQYPAGTIGTHYWFFGDSVVVTARNTSRMVADVIYEGLIGYEWWISANHNIQIFIKPEETGIVLEEEYVEGELVEKREILSWQVYN